MLLLPVMLLILLLLLPLSLLAMLRHRVPEEWLHLIGRKETVQRGRERSWWHCRRETGLKERTWLPTRHPCAHLDSLLLLPMPLSLLDKLLLHHNVHLPLLLWCLWLKRLELLKGQVILHHWLLPELRRQDRGR